MIKKVVLLGADWCGPCRLLKPLVNSVSQSYDHVETVVLNYDSAEGAEFASKHGIRGVPALLSFDENDNRISQNVGTLTELELNDFYQGSIDK